MAERPVVPVVHQPEAPPVLTSTTLSSQEALQVSRTDMSRGYGEAAVPVPPDVTVFRMINRVYGRFSDKLLLQFMASNPKIQSPEHVLAGTDLFFPVSEFAKPVPETGIFPVIMETKKFSIAFSKALSREFTKDMPVRILAHPLANGSFFFRVILDHSFGTQSQGLAFMEKKYPNFPLDFLDMVSLAPGQTITKGSAL